MFDTDQDGVITFNETRNIFRCLGKRVPDESIEEKVKKHSEDQKNLSLEFNEFLKLISGELKEDPTSDQEQLLQAFRMFDKDEDGKLTEEELRRIMVSLGEFAIKDAEFDEILQLVERDEDGLLDYTELCNVLC